MQGAEDFVEIQTVIVEYRCVGRYPTAHAARLDGHVLAL